MKKILTVGLLVFVGVVGYVYLLKTNEPATTPVFTGEVFTFYCPGDFTFTVQYDVTAEHARLSLSGVQYLLERAPAGSGSRYQSIDEAAEFWEHQDEAMLRLPGMTEMTTCQRTPIVPKPEPELIEIDAPQSGVQVQNPITLSGRARGYWFFEASAPVVVVDWDGRIIGEGYVTADGEWMTEDLVPFSGEVSYDLPVDSYSASGTVIFRRDNPSGLPENDAAVEVPVVLQRG